jgi:hypothetical protein
MFHSLKRFWLVWVLLLLGTQSMFGYALLGPIVGSADAWQVNVIGFFLAPPSTNVADIGGPKNIGEGYRWNTPNIYYAYDDNFITFFGSNGVAAVDAAFAMFNNLSNVDSYSSDLSEWPQTSQRINSTANALFLMDLKSSTMQLIAEQLGLAQPVRWIYCLHDRFLPTGAVCPAYEYQVVERNYDPVTQVYSPYVNGTLYGFSIEEECPLTVNPVAPLEADAVEYPADPAAYAAGLTFAVADMMQLNPGYFFTSLTRDDLGGLRYLYSSNRINTEVVEPNTTEYFTNFDNQQLLVTSNLAVFSQQALTNSPTNLLALYPQLIITSSSNFFTNELTTNVTAVFSQPPNAPAGTLIVVFTTNYTTNVVINYAYTFGNVVTNHFYTNGYITTSVTNVVAPPEAPAGYLQTNIVNSTVFTSFINGDFHIIPTNFCGFTTPTTQLVSVIDITNTIGTNGPTVTGGITNGQSTAFNLITYFTNYSLLFYPIQCDSNNAVELREGVEKVNFVRVDFDSLLSGNWGPVTNVYTLTQVTNSAPLVQTYRRVITAPDILITAQDEVSGPAGVLFDFFWTRNNNPNSSQALPGLAGPGTWQPNITFSYNKAGPVFVSENPFFITDASPMDFEWASFDGTTNDPVIYPSTVSLSNLLSQIFLQITNSVLPDASVSTNNAGNPYSFQLQAVGGTPPYTWSVPTNTPALPPGLNLSTNGVVFGSPTTTGIYDFVVQATDFGSRTNQRELTIQVDP